MIEIIPAILTAEPADLDTKLFQVESFASGVQIDVADGNFVPNKTVDFHQVSKFESSLKFEIHLMAQDPQSYISVLKRVLPLPSERHRIIFHIEAAKNTELIFSKIKEAGFKSGLALNPGTDFQKIVPYINAVELVLFLGVEPGFQGHEFIPAVLGKIKKFKTSHPETLVGIDGGIKRENIKSIAASGVDEIVVGSEIWGAENPKDEYIKLKQLASAALM